MTTFRDSVFALALTFVFAATVRADQIVIAGKNHVGAKVISYEIGTLTFRTSDGRTQSSFVDPIELLIVDRGGSLEDFNQAERFLADGDADKAGLRYDRVVRLASDFWADVAAVRAVQAHDRAGQIEKAVLSFIRTVRGRSSGPVAAARILPVGVSAKRDSRVAQAIEQLDLALLQDPGESIRVLLEILRYDILRRADDTRAARFAMSIAGLTVPEELLADRTCSVITFALADALRSDPSVERLSSLDRAIAGCPSASLPELLMLKGDTLLRVAATREDFLRAGWAYLRVVAHFSDEPAAPVAMIRAASTMEKAARSDYAVKLLEQAATHPRSTESIRKQASDSIQKIRAASGRLE